jgi:hypothetical protein
MAYTGRGTMPTIGGIGGMLNPPRFNDQSVANAFDKALKSSGAQRLQAGQFFTGEGGAQYKTVAGIDPNQPGWGNMVDPNYELVGYQNPVMYTGMQRQLYGSTPQTPGFAILRKKEEPKPEVEDEKEKTTEPPTIVDPPKVLDPEPTGPSESDLAIKALTDQISSLTSGFQTSLQDQAAQFQKLQAAQEERMANLQNMMIQQAASQAERPTVTGVKTATGSAGTAMQIARRGVSGTFGRRGMRIQSLNV